MLVGDPKKLILIGVVLVVLGVLLPMLMVLDMIRTTFLMALLAHGASVSGLFLGFIGTLMIVRLRKPRSPDERFAPSSWYDEPTPKN